MADDERQIRALIERWTKAVHAGDMEGVLVDHADDIVMYDVPPPNDGVRGIDGYRETWPPFFKWQQQGAVFEIVSLEVTAGDDVAYAHALLRCGTPEELKKDPANRLRLTIGLRKASGRWLIAHEHIRFRTKLRKTKGPGPATICVCSKPTPILNTVAAVTIRWDSHPSPGGSIRRPLSRCVHRAVL